MKRLTIALLVLVTLFSFVSCKDEPEPPKEHITTITLDKNTGSSNGSVTATYGAGWTNFTKPVKSDVRIEGFYTNTDYTTKVADGNGNLIAGVAGYTDSEGKWINLDSSTILYTRWEYRVRYMDPDGLLVNGLGDSYVKQGGKATRPAVATKTDAESGYEYRWSTVAPGTGAQQTAYDFDKVLTDDLTLYLLYTYKNTGNVYTVYNNILQKYSGSETNLTIPANIDGRKITVVYNATLNMNNSVTSVVVSEGIEEVRVNAFYLCKNLTSISIPKSVRVLEGGFFNLSSNVSTLTVDPENTKFKSVDNVIYSIDGKKVIAAAPAKTTYTFPDTVVEIDSMAFKYCRLTSVVIPDRVTSIGGYAFSNNEVLASVTLPAGLAAVPSGCFYYCYKLADISLPETVTSIGQRAFEGCYSLTSFTIPENVTSIGEYAFEGCRGLTSLSFPDGITSLEADVLASCTKLESFTIPESVTIIKTYAFYNCTSLVDITVPDSVESIGNCAFKNCKNLKDVVFNRHEVYEFPSEDPFTGCTNLEHIYVASDLVSAYQAAPGWSAYASKIAPSP